MMRSILHLNGWQRIGIVASIFWIVGSGFTVRKTETAHAMRVYGSAYGRCLKIEGIQQTYDYSRCAGEADAAYKTELKLTVSLARVAVLSFGTVFIAWPVAYLLIGTWKWVRRGFETASPH